MPTYDYVCGACGHAFEHFQSMSSRRLRTCPSCGQRKLDRLVGTGAGIIFKGSGFYETDYKRSAQPKSESSGEGSSAGGKADSGGSESTPSGGEKASGGGTTSGGGGGDDPA